MSTDSPSLAEVLDATDTAFAVTDQRCRVRWLNPAMAELLGLSVEQAVGRSLPALLARAPEGPHDGMVVSFRPVRAQACTQGGARDRAEVRWVGMPCTEVAD